MDCGHSKCETMFELQGNFANLHLSEFRCYALINLQLKSVGMHISSAKLMERCETQHQEHVWANIFSLSKNENKLLHVIIATLLFLLSIWPPYSFRISYRRESIPIKNKTQTLWTLVLLACRSKAHGTGLRTEQSMLFSTELYYHRGKKSALKFSLDKLTTTRSHKYVNYIWKHVRLSHGYLYHARTSSANKNLYFWVLLSTNDNFFTR